MLRRLQSRHPIDLPRGKWGRAKIAVAIFAPLVALFVALPFAISPLAAIYQDWSAGFLIPPSLLLVVAGVGTLALVLAIGAIKGKPGWDR